MGKYGKHMHRERYTPRAARTPALAELAERTLAATSTLSEQRRKLRVATDEFHSAGRAIAASEQAASVRDGSDLASHLAEIAKAKARRETAASTIGAVTKEIGELERGISEMEDQLRRAAGELINPKRLEAVIRYRNAAGELKSARDDFYALGLALDVEPAQLGFLMSIQVPDLENYDDLLYAQQIPDFSQSLATVQRAIHAASRAHSS